MTKYTPRKCSVRWLDGDCPKGVLVIMDHPKFADRFTVIYSEIYGGEGRQGFMSGRGMSATPSHPQGVGMLFELTPCEVAAYRYRNKHRYCKWSDLPQAVQECVRRDLEDAR